MTDLMQQSPMFLPLQKTFNCSLCGVVCKYPSEASVCPGITSKRANTNRHLASQAAELTSLTHSSLQRNHATCKLPLQLQLNLPPSKVRFPLPLLLISKAAAMWQGVQVAAPDLCNQPHLYPAHANHSYKSCTRWIAELHGCESSTSH